MFLAPLSAVSADGMIVKPYWDRYEYYNESVQQAYINYENGRQSMILSIGLEDMTDNLVWIFPVPAKPDKVIIDNNITNMPRLYGYDISDKAKDDLSGMQLLLSLNQIYPAFFLPFIDAINYGPIVYDSGIMPLMGATGMAEDAKRDQVTVYEHLENDGVVTELLTADSSNVLQDYFDSKNLKVTADELASLQSYYGKENTLVVSWLTPIYRLNDRLYPQPLYDQSQGISYEEDKTLDSSYSDIYMPQPYYMRGLLVSFPTDRIYFPLIPTSVYGSEVVPAVIKVMGLVTPDVYGDISSYTQVSYNRIDSYYSPLENLPADFVGSRGSTQGLEYTTIDIKAPSKLLTEDLYIDQYAPLNVHLGNLISSAPLVFFLIPLLFNSMLASTVAGFIVFKEARTKRFWIYTLLGLGNILTILSFIFIVAFTATRNIKPEDQALFDQLRSKGYSISAFKIADWRKLIFIPLFSILYLVFTLIGGELMKVLV
jgi:hypothetical protein